MAMELLYRVVMFVALWLAQVLILNHIWLFNLATPLLYVYFAVTFRRNTPQWQVLLWCFALGLLVDVFSSTPGLAAGTMTLIGFLQPFLLEVFAPHDAAENLKSSASTLGWGKFSTLCGVLVLIYCLVFFALEAFNFFSWVLWLGRAVASTLLTLLLILAIESVRSR